jgi:hypothetical protein
VLAATCIRCSGSGFPAQGTVTMYGKAPIVEADHTMCALAA